MKTNYKEILIFALIIITCCFASIFIFNYPSFIKIFDLSNDTKSNIGSAIGGVTAPIIGIFSSILLYLALTKQTQSNIDQRLKNESDLLFLLLNQLDKEMSNFYYKHHRGGIEFKSYGNEAIQEFIKNFSNSSLDKLDFTFKRYNAANQILLIVRSYKLIEARIQTSELSVEMKCLFEKKLSIYFDCILKVPLERISNIIDKHSSMKDEVSEEIQEFIRLNTK